MPRALIAALLVAAVCLLAVAPASEAARGKQRKAKVHRSAGSSLWVLKASKRQVGWGTLRSVSKPSRRPGPVASTIPAPSAVPVATPQPAPDPLPEPLGSFASVRVSDSATNFSFTLSRPVLAAGRVQLQLQNRGEDPHDLTVGPEAGGAPVAGTGSVDPGQNPTLGVDLPAGRYRLYCSLYNHAQRGMQATLEVR